MIRPSEHNVNDRHFPLEMHCVHKAADGSLLVVGILLDYPPHGLNRGNRFFNPLLSQV